MFKYLINWFLIFSLLPGTAFGVNINGEMKNALLENSASDPVTNVVESRLYWNSTSKKPLIYNGSAWSELGGSGGSGEKNYITNPSAASVNPFTCVGDLDAVRTSTASELPRENTTATGIKITADANTQSTADYCYIDFTLDDIDLNRKLNVKFATKQTGSYVASDLAVVITTQADRTTAVATPVVTNIAAADYDFDANGFDTASTTTLSLVIRATTDMADAAGIVISDVIVGPGKIQAVPAVGYLGTVSPTFSAGFGTVTTRKIVAWRNGDTLRVKGLIDTGTVAASALYIALPAGYTIDSSKYGTTTNAQAVGWAQRLRTSGSATANYSIRNVLFYDGSDTANIYVALNQVTSAAEQYDKSLGNAVFASGDAVDFDFEIPIAEWAGAPNYAGSNVLEYYSTSGTWDAASSTTTYGPSGTIMGGALTAARTKTITTLTSIQATDIIELQLNTGYGWHSIESYGYGFVRQNTTYYGAYLQVTGTNTIAVTFNQYGVPSGATYASAGSAWSSSFYWRVVKAKSGQAVGFGAATSTASGLVSNETSGSFTLTATGFTTTPTTTGYYTRTGKQVTIAMSGDISATSNATTFTLTGMPSTLYPARNTDGPMSNLRDNTGSFVVGSYRVTSAGVIELYLAGRGGFTASGTKALLQNSFTYYVD